MIRGGSSTDCSAVGGAVVICLDNVLSGGTTFSGGNDHLAWAVIHVDNGFVHSYGGLVHEFGHGLGLGHHDLPGDAVGASVMTRDANSNPLNPTQLDKDNVRLMYDHVDCAGCNEFPSARNIRNVNSNLVIDVPGSYVDSGVAVIQYGLNDPPTKNQQWAVEPMGDGSFRVINRNSQMALESFGTTVGSSVGQATWHGGPRQRWLLQAQGTGKQFRNQASNLCLDVPFSSTEPGAGMILYQCTGGLNQTWTVPQA